VAWRRMMGFCSVAFLKNIFKILTLRSYPESNGDAQRAAGSSRVQYHYAIRARLYPESNWDAPKGLDFKSSAIPLCDTGLINEERFGF
jgi:hypothetical protein